MANRAVRDDASDCDAGFANGNAPLHRVRWWTLNHALQNVHLTSPEGETSARVCSGAPQCGQM
jgi:hypothetical protein